ncbi:MAG: protein-L-isoaspartate(D-aspartate) O-methyltransferase [Pseudomonadota bacterium]
MAKQFWIIICLCVYSFCSVCCVASEPKEEEYTRLRHEMVKNQIESRGISHPRVLDALKTVPRHRFVPGKNRNLAYNDYPLPIGEEQTISQPYIVALMTEILNPDPEKNILEIGTGSGYQAAILAQLYKQVYTIEIIDILGRQSRKLLAELGYRNVQVKIGDGYQGWKEHSPFDAIIVTCAPSHIPEPLKEQLAEGGKMIIPVGKADDQRLILLVKEKGKIREKEVIPVRFVPMMGEDGKKY